MEVVVGRSLQRCQNRSRTTVTLFAAHDQAVTMSFRTVNGSRTIVASKRRRSRRPRGECQPLKPRGDRWAKPASSRPTDPPQGADAMIHKRKATFKPFLENLEDRR